MLLTLDELARHDLVTRDDKADQQAIADASSFPPVVVGPVSSDRGALYGPWEG
jgi:hypothetical protein